MPKQYDAATKVLVEGRPADWLLQLGFEAGIAAEVIDADLSAVTAQADRVIRVAAGAAGGESWLLHIELQASRDAELSRRVARYNVLLFERHAMAAHSVVVLLRPQADDSGLTGRVSYAPPREIGGMDFRFQVMRVWQTPLEALLEGGIGTLPLAPLSDVPADRLPGVIERMKERISSEVENPGDRGVIWTATDILLGLRMRRDKADMLLKGVSEMEESDTYQAILEKGETRGVARGVVLGAIRKARNLLFELGTDRWGPPPPAIRARIENEVEEARIDAWVRRIYRVGGWEELVSSRE